MSGRNQPNVVPHVRWVDTSQLASSILTSELINIFEIFLPQLLRYPNPADPLNGEAAALLMRDPAGYNKKVEMYVERYATPEDADQAAEDDDEDDSDEEAPRPKKVENGSSKTNGKATTTNGNGSKAEADDDEEDEEDDDKMSDMGELSDGDDEFMGEMDD